MKIIKKIGTKNRIRAVFFDLDGTLLDTAPDLVGALNQVLHHHGRAEIPFENLRHQASNGARGLLCTGFQMDITHPDYESLRAEFLTTYQQCLTQRTAIFPGIALVLRYLDENHLPWGIVTNKPQWLAEPLLTHFALHHRYRCLVSGDTLPERKPHPAPLHHACDLLSVLPSETIYIGDTELDITAANAAGMSAVLATYGYLDKTQAWQTWHFDACIEKPEDILSLLDKTHDDT